MEDDELLDPKEKELDEEEVDDLDDGLIAGKKKPKKSPIEDDSLDELAEEEVGETDEDKFDDVDLW